jgi:hypothetical protein
LNYECGLQQLTLGDDELTARLLRGVSLNLPIEDRRETIILNAKSLLDLDADARYFAARILLSYIYEETLPWKVIAHAFQCWHAALATLVMLSALLRRQHRGNHGDVATLFASLKMGGRTRLFVDCCSGQRCAYPRHER